MNNRIVLPGHTTKNPSAVQLVTIQELQDTEQRIIHAVKSLLTQHGGGTLKKWLKSYEVKKLLAVSSGTLQTLRNNGTIPFTKIGGIIYYSTDDINDVLETMKKGKLQNGKTDHQYK